ncbi:hypothetical protein [Aquiflexum gelatinilyticum]|uniref:hypothetical protein n=1 Tax=Aquiflexum gelatinilyticum TaxID=2961943 RepID=UPI0021684E14|nr:hypothetical protein [Aquiflexum gelatinilyticum]MCS4432843.1 hypothetical protein [Aquiflexum gelatinilyticum]
MSTETIDPRLIKDRIDLENGITEYILENYLDSGEETKLGHVFKFLPSGILHKEETGIGATTLELKSKRNSIIVEPLRSTALTKSSLSEDYFFVGTKPDGVTVSDEEIKEFITKQERSGEFIKIICVADSLKRVINVLGKEKLESDEYHLLIDESDSFQTASSYRKSLDLVLDQYKEYFRPERRSMVTATPLDFSDPLLKSELVTKFRYHHLYKKDLVMVLTDKVTGKLYDLIKKHFEETPEEKLVVAYNHVGEIRNLADKLCEKKIRTKKDIKVLCSYRSEHKVKKYFHELESTMLPAKLVFKSSAYFVGYDIDEPYHLIIGTSTGNNVMQLSELTIKQIIGRARKGLHSITVVSSQKILPEVKRYDLAQLLEIANHQLEGYRCLVRNFERSKHLLEEVLMLKERVEGAMHIGGFTPIRTNLEGQPDISYLNIDGYLEQTRVKKEIYSVHGGLEKALTKIGYNVISKSEVAAEVVSASENKLKELAAMKAEVEKDLPGSSGVFDLKVLEKDGGSESQKLAYEIYNEYQHYIDADFLKEQIVIKMSFSSEGGSKKSLNLFKQVLYYHVLDPSVPFKKHILSRINVGNKYSKDYLLTCVNDALAMAGLHHVYSEFKQAKKILNNFFEIKGDERPKKVPKPEVKNQKVLSFRMTKDRLENEIAYPLPKKYKSFDIDRFRALSKLRKFRIYT